MQHDFILLDRSGSMSNIWIEAIGSINSYVHKLAEQKVDTGVTLVAFDSTTMTGGMDFHIVRDRIVPSTWRDVTTTEVSPRSYTPLNDATAQMVTLAENGGYDKVACIIMTDGAENSSVEYSVTNGGTTKVKDMLDRCRAKGWQIIFLGANFDNVQQATSYGSSPLNQVRTSARNLGATMSATASMRGAYGLTGQSMNFSDTFKQAVEQDAPVDADTINKVSDTSSAS